MIWQRLPEEFPFHPTTVRSLGIHVTDLLRRIAYRTFNTASAPDTDAERSRRLMEFEKGFLWEDVLSLAFGSRLASRPGELILNGIAGTPDGIAVDSDGELVVEEYKATTFSSLKTPDDFWSYCAQCRAYCHMVGANRAILRILHIRGDYRAEPWPHYAVWRLDFTDLELLDNWEMLQNEAATLEMEREATLTALSPDSDDDIPF